MYVNVSGAGVHTHYFKYILLLLPLKQGIEPHPSARSPFAPLNNDDNEISSRRQ